MDGSGHNNSLPAEGVSAAANLFALIVESELKGNSYSANPIFYIVFALGITLFLYFNIVSE